MAGLPTRASPLASRFDRFVIKHARWEDVGGIPVEVLAGYSDRSSRQKLRDAIELLAKYSPATIAGFQRLCRGIIVARTYIACGMWRPTLEACIVDIDYIRSAYTSPESLAGLLAHELMHARLNAWGIDSGTGDEERRGRIERICCLASQQVLAKLPESDARNTASGAFDDYMQLQPAPWADVELARAYRLLPWYWRVFRFIVQELPANLHRDLPT